MKTLFELQKPQERQQPVVQNSSGALKTQSVSSMKQIEAAALSAGAKHREYERPEDDIRGMPNKGARYRMVLGNR
jgi:hypothetical protein